MEEELKLVTIYHSQGILSAEVIRAKLEAAGVPVMLQYESAGLVLGLTVDGLGLVKVQVPEEWEADALALIEEEDEGAGEVCEAQAVHRSDSDVQS